jgi:cytochrome c oxidase subunit 2
MNELFRTLLMLPEQASTLAPEIDLLHYSLISTAMLGWLLTLLATVVFLVRYRRGAPARAKAPRQIPVWLEVVGYAGLLTMFVAFWFVGARQYVALYTPPENALNVYVVGKQWMWSFAYPDGVSNNRELVVPAGQPVKLIITSRDVIHSFYVPAFRIKQDAVPGRVTITWFTARHPGEHEILCAEYCGLSHSHMRGTVRVLEPSEYQAWLERRSTGESSIPLASLGRREPGSARRADLAQAGERVAAERGCLRCHTLDGTPHLGPSFAGLFGAQIPLDSGHTIRADEAYLTRSMMDPQADVHRGFEPIMPSYMGILSATDTAALVEMIRTLSASGSEPRMPLARSTKRRVALPTSGNGDAAEAQAQLHPLEQP